MRTQRKFLVWMMTFFLLASVIPTAALADEADEDALYSIDSGRIAIIVNEDGSYTVSQNEKTDEYSSNIPITLSGSGSYELKELENKQYLYAITISSSQENNSVPLSLVLDSMTLHGIIKIQNTNVNITLQGTNEISPAEGVDASLYITDDSCVTIDGTGSLKCVGSGKDSAWNGFAGITVSNANESNTKLTINGGTIEAEGASSYGAGIGAKWWESCGSIIINGGTVIAKAGGAFAAGIGGSDNTSGDYAYVQINGGTVTATGGTYAAAIGAGIQTKESHVEITGGTIIATAGKEKRNQGYRYSYAIGVGTEVSELSLSSVTIDGGTLITSSEMLSDCSNAKNSDGKILGQIKISGLTASHEINKLCVDDISYGLKDVTTNQFGELYVWLPVSQSSIVEIVSDNSNYTYAGPISDGMKLNCESDDKLLHSFVPMEFSKEQVGSSGEEYKGSIVKWGSEITFDANGGSFETGTTGPITVEEDKAISTVSENYALPTPAKPDSAFAGWNTAADGTGTFVTTSTVPVGSMTVYAIWGVSAGESGYTLLPIENQTYTGNAIEPTVYMVDKDGNRVVASSVTYENNINAGTATAKVTIDGVAYPVTFTISKATPTISISASPETLPGGTVTLMVDKPGLPNDAEISVTCDNTVYNPTAGADGEYTVILPNTSGAYQFTATYAGDANHEAASANCTVTVTRTSGGSSSSSSGYAVSVDSAKHGSVTVSPKSAKKGDTVTITVKPDSGYELDDLTVTDKDGDELKLTKKSDTKYTFTMPASKVEVEATFVKIKEAPEQTFTDVPANFWAEDAIAWAYENGCMNGSTAATFAPEGTVSRQQLWMVLARLSGYNPADMAEAKSWAVDNGISDGTAPGGSVSRQQLVTILYRYAVRMGYKTSGSADLTAYPDHASVAAYAKDAMSWSVANSIVGGTTQGTLNPAGTATRAQFAVILSRFCENIAG